MADQAGQEKYSTEVVLQNFRGELVLLDSREGGGGGAAAGTSAATWTTASAAAAAAGSAASRALSPRLRTDLDDDVPF